MIQDEVRKSFGYEERYDVRLRFVELREFLLTVLPNGPEKTLALSRLTQSESWANNSMEKG